MTCARGEMRASANGLFIYDRNGKRKLALPPSNAMPGRSEDWTILSPPFARAKNPLHDGRWGKANVEATLAVLRSARERREIMLRSQAWYLTRSSPASQSAP